MTLGDVHSAPCPFKTGDLVVLARADGAMSDGTNPLSRDWLEKMREPRMVTNTGLMGGEWAVAALLDGAHGWWLADRLKAYAPAETGYL